MEQGDQLGNRSDRDIQTTPIINELRGTLELLEMKSLQANMSSGPGYYEGELYNVIRNGRGVPAVPLVIIGVSP